LIELPSVWYLTGQSGILVICPVEECQSALVFFVPVNILFLFLVTAFCFPPVGLTYFLPRWLNIPKD